MSAPAGQGSQVTAGPGRASPGRGPPGGGTAASWAPGAGLPHAPSDKALGGRINSLLTLNSNTDKRPVKTSGVRWGPPAESQALGTQRGAAGRPWEGGRRREAAAGTVKHAASRAGTGAGDWPEYKSLSFYSS